MAKFQECSTGAIVYRGTTLVNRPVNLDLVTSFDRGRRKHYPDNTGLPTIDFYGIDVQWVYPNDIERDADYVRIVES